MEKIFPYAVIWNGEIVPTNTPIKIKEAPKEPKEREEPKTKGGKK